MCKSFCVQKRLCVKGSVWKTIRRIRCKLLSCTCKKLSSWYYSSRLPIIDLVLWYSVSILTAEDPAPLRSRAIRRLVFFPTSLCGVLVSDSVSRLCLLLRHARFHTQLCHTPSFTIPSFTRNFVHTQLCHTQHLSHTTLSPTILWHLWHWAGPGGALGRALVRGAAPLCMAGVALGDIDVRFAWQAWHLWHPPSTLQVSPSLSNPTLSHTHTTLSRTICQFHISLSLTCNLIAQYGTQLCQKQLFRTQLFHTHLSHTQLCHQRVGSCHFFFVCLCFCGFCCFLLFFVFFVFFCFWSLVLFSHCRKTNQTLSMVAKQWENHCTCAVSVVLECSENPHS